MGAINLDNTGSGGAVTLSSDGTDLLLGGSAIGGGAAAYTIDTKTANYTIVAGDLGKIINVTANDVTLTLTAAATLGAGWFCYIRNSSAASGDIVTIDGNGSETIEGGTTYALYRDMGVQLVCDGSNFFLVYTGNSGLASNVLTTDNSSYFQPVASGDQSIAFGQRAEATGYRSIAAGGYYARAEASESAAIGGSSARASGNNALAMMSSSHASGANSIAIGYNASANSAESVGIGASAKGYGTAAVALGNSYASGTDSFAAAIANNTSSYGASGANSVAIGAGLARATNSRAMAFGNNAIASGADSVAIGRSTDATASASFGFGYAVLASHANSVVLGTSASSSAINQITLGSNSDTVRISSAYTLPTADGSANQVLTTNGSGAVSFAAAPSPDTFSDNKEYGVNPTTAGSDSFTIGVSATCAGDNSFALGVSATCAGQGAASMGKFAAAGAQYSAAVGYNASSGGDSSLAVGYGSAVASNSAFGTAVGYEAEVAASSFQAMALGRSYVSGQYATSINIGNHSSSYGAAATYATAIGYQAKATGSNSTAIGPRATASGDSSLSLCTSYANYGNTSSGLNSITIGDGNSASEVSSIAIGYGAKSEVKGKIAFASRSFADGNAEGSSQGGIFILVSDTTDATAEAMTTNNSTAAATNQIVAATDTCITFSGTIVAMQNGAQSYGSWEIKGLLVNDGGTTTVPNSAITVIQNASSWGLALSADNTNNALKIQVTGEASHNIRWVANVQTAEVTFA